MKWGSELWEHWGESARDRKESALQMPFGKKTLNSGDNKKAMWEEWWEILLGSRMSVRRLTWTIG